MTRMFAAPSLHALPFYRKENHMTGIHARPGRFLLGALLLCTACSAAAARRDPAVPPSMTIERFLRAANEKDLDTMISLFGTRDGSVKSEWSKQEADARMFVLASVLAHSDYTI